MAKKSGISDKRFSGAPRKHSSKGSEADLLALASKIRAVRIASGLTQDQLALVSGVGRDTIIALESARGGVSLAKALRIMRGLGLGIASKART